MLSTTEEVLQGAGTGKLTGSKDITDFLLEEYKNIAQAHFNSHEVTAKWIKFYLLIMATPFSFVLFIYKQTPQSFNFLEMPNTLSTYTFLIGILGILISVIVINLWLDSILYARTVNGIRRFFIENDAIYDISQKKDRYFVLLSDINKPKFFKISGDLTILTFMMSLINSLYIGCGLAQISHIKSCYIEMFAQSQFILLTSALTLIFNCCIYIYNSKVKKKDYGKTE